MEDDISTLVGDRRRKKRLRRKEEGVEGTEFCTVFATAAGQRAVVVREASVLPDCGCPQMP